MPTVAEALEALGHPHGALPEPRLLADLFARFQAQVPVRRARGPAGPDTLLAAWLEEGEGCCGEERVEAFRALADAAGFALAPGVACEGDGAERRVLLSADRRALLDPGFPLPSALALDPPAEPVSTGYGTLSVRSAPGTASDVLLETRGAVRRLYRVEPAAMAEHPASRAHADEDPGLFRLLDDRLLRFRAGVLEVSDAWSRLRIPFPSSDVEGLEALFGPPIPTEAIARAGRADAVPTLAVYHASDADAPRLLRLLSDPAGHAALLPAGWTVQGLAAHQDGFERTLYEEGTLLRREKVTYLPDGALVEADGPLALFRSRVFRLGSRPEGTRLRLLATLRDPAPPRGLPEGTRRRLVFELASELLALDRLSTEG